MVPGFAAVDYVKDLGENVQGMINRCFPDNKSG